MFTETGGTVADLINRVFDPTITIADLAWLREAWDGPIVIKGIQTVDDARAVVDAGADGIVISNHGGRQLDRAPTPLEQLPAIMAAVGDRAEVYLDGGVLSGADVIAAVALGADAVMVGRAYLYGLMAGGERGVDARRRDPPQGGDPDDAAPRCPAGRRPRARTGSPPGPIVEGATRWGRIRKMSMRSGFVANDLAVVRERRRPSGHSRPARARPRGRPASPGSGR